MGGDSSSLTVVGFLFLVCMGVLTWALQRKYALIPLLITTCYMPLGQMFVVAGLHFPLFRILLLVGVCRVFVRKEAHGLQLTRPDKIFLYWVTVTLIIGTLTKFSFERFINRSGEVYSALGSYFLFRCWIRNLGDVKAMLRFLGWMILPLAVSMIIEKSTTRNIFAVFGGVPDITAEREGTLRCQGAFRHPILAGTYAATLFPLFVGLRFQGSQNRLSATIGICSAIFVTFAAGSSGALLAMISASIGLILWSARNRMRLFRWSILLMLALLAFIMKAPVWYVIARVSEIAGGTGWHRSYLIDQAISHFNEWWLVGSSYTAHWAPGGQVLAVDPNNMDITNQYIAEGLEGGILKLTLFLAMIVQGFKAIGRFVHRPEIPVPDRILVWSFGVGLTAHCVSFLSVSYYDQIVVMWYWILAVLSVLTEKKIADRIAVKAEAGSFTQHLNHFEEVRVR